jgi:hypothetical protein
VSIAVEIRNGLSGVYQRGRHSGGHRTSKLHAFTTKVNIYATNERLNAQIQSSGLRASQGRSSVADAQSVHRDSQRFGRRPQDREGDILSMREKNHPFDGLTLTYGGLMLG